MLKDRMVVHCLQYSLHHQTRMQPLFIISDMEQSLNAWLHQVSGIVDFLKCSFSTSHHSSYEQMNIVVPGNAHSVSHQHQLKSLTRFREDYSNKRTSQYCSYCTVGVVEEMEFQKYMCETMKTKHHQFKIPDENCRPLFFARKIVEQETAFNCRTSDDVMPSSTGDCPRGYPLAHCTNSPKPFEPDGPIAPRSKCH